MSTYWEKAIKKILTNVSDVEEDWEKRTVSFDVFTTDVLKITLAQLNQLGALLSEHIAMEIKGDDRYKDSPGVLMHFHISQVKFPKQPE